MTSENDLIAGKYTPGLPPGEHVLVVSADKYLRLPSGRYCWSRQRIGYARQLALSDFNEMMAEEANLLEDIILLIGIPGSGKTTFIYEMDFFLSKGVLFIDAMNLTPPERRLFIVSARRRGVPIHAVHMDTPLEVCLERNEERHPSRRVPEERIRHMQRRLQAPNELEGFATIETMSQWRK